LKLELFRFSFEGVGRTVTEEIYKKVKTAAVFIFSLLEFSSLLGIEFIGNF